MLLRNDYSNRIPINTYIILLYDIEKIRRPYNASLVYRNDVRCIFIYFFFTLLTYERITYYYDEKKSKKTEHLHRLQWSIGDTWTQVTNSVRLNYTITQ